MEVPSPKSGTVAEVKVAVGDRVSEGFLILTLEVGEAQVPEQPSPAGLQELDVEPAQPPAPELAPPSPIAPAELPRRADTAVTEQLTSVLPSVTASTNRRSGVRQGARQPLDPAHRPRTGCRSWQGQGIGPEGSHLERGRSVVRQGDADAAARSRSRGPTVGRRPRLLIHLLAEGLELGNVGPEKPNPVKV